jgi:transglutaminase-like putative cysteine protease
VAPDRKMTVTAAAACVLASTALSPLFTSPLWFAASAGAVVVVASTGTVTRLRPLPAWACLAAGVASLLLYLNLVFAARHSLLFVIPTPSSVARLRDLVDAGLHDRTAYAPPVPNVPGLLLPAVAGAGMTAVLTDLIAVRLRAAALAGLPLLVLFTVPVMMNASHNRVADGLVFCAGGAGYLTMITGGRTSLGGRSLTAAGQSGAASVVLALCAPSLLSGVHVGDLFSSGGGGPLTQTMTQLHEGRPSVVFTYTTTASPSLQRSDPQYFRQYVYDTLGDAGWQVSDSPAGAAHGNSMPVPPGLTDMSASQPVTTTVTTTRNFPGGHPVVVPLPYPVIKVTAPGQLRADQDLMVSSTTRSLAGLTYSAMSYAVDPSPAQLQAVPPLTGQPSLAPDVRLPVSYQSAALKQLAQRHASGQATEFGKVNALASWLSAPPFRYSLSAAPSGSAAGMLSFLTAGRTGYCVQYASALTVLTRLLGIPARFVTGYTAGKPGSGGSYQVSTTDAHAWTEVYFPAFGWIRFEPTPGGAGGTASRPDYMMSVPAGNTTALPPEPGAGASAGSGSLPASPRLTGPSMLARQPGTGREVRSAQTPQVAAVLAMIAAIALALLTPAALRVTRRHWRWMRATDDVARTHVAWHEFHDDLADFGFGGRPGEPPRTLAARVSAEMPEPAAGAVRRLALAEERASYAGRTSGSPPSLRRDGVIARRALAVTARRGTRWRARVFPASLLPGGAAAFAHVVSRSKGRRPRWKPERARRARCSHLNSR